MYCKKCGQEFPDGMTNCLWCGAPNDDYGKEMPDPVEEGVDVESSEPAESGEAPAAGEHPAGNFMWSVALGTPFIAFLVHYKKLSYEFLFVLVGINVLLNICDKLLVESIDWEQYPLLKMPVFAGYWVARFCVMGKAGAWRMKIDGPEYDEKEYRRKEKIAIVLGLVYMALMITIELVKTFK